MKVAIESLLALIFLVPQQSPQTIAATLSRAQDLYYEARFKESIDVLLPLDSNLRSQPGRLKEKIDVKLQLALAHVGLNQMDQASSRFAEICDLDPDYTLEPGKFAPKVISSFEAVKNESGQRKCKTLCAEADKLLEAGNSDGLLMLIEQSRSKCACVEATALDAATHFAQVGVDAYKNNDFESAMKNFELALKFDSTQQLARSYLDLIRDRQQVAADKTYTDWRAQMDSRNYGLAAATYRRLTSMSSESGAAAALDKVRAGYRAELAPAIESWKRACSARDTLTMTNARTRAEQILPDPELNKDFLSEFGTCIAPKSECVALTTQAAMSRVRSTPTAKLPSEMRLDRLPNDFSLKVNVNVRIDNKGAVRVIDPQTIDAKIRNAVVAAVNGWRFVPTLLRAEDRCAETTIAVVLVP